MKTKIVLLALTFALITSFHLNAAVTGWLAWRGPDQNGTSRETGLPDKVDPAKPLWRASFPGQSTSVIANGKLYIMGYLGEGPELGEGVACFDAETGKKLWEKLYSDFLSDIIYERYSTSSPTIDPETGNIYMQGTQGILACFTPDGKEIWKTSMMEAFGRLTFPNARTASPIIDKDLVITRGITANWGAHGPGGDRFYAFDKKTGELVWSGWSGERPRDNSYSHSYLTSLGGRRVLYSATGDGNVVCLNARTGEVLWRVPLFKAGINASVVVHNNDKIIAIYGTPYEPGQMVALRITNAVPNNATSGPVVLERAQVELWSNDISTSTSSPILVGDRVYVVSEKGDLCSVDVNTGKILWRVKVGIEQRNSSLLYADGKLYVPVLEAFGKESSGEGASETGSKGGFFIIKPHDDRGEILSQVALDGRCFGSPVAYNGKVYVQTTRHLYAFGKPGNNPGLPKPAMEPAWPKPGTAAHLQIVPSEVLLRPGQEANLRVRTLDANGFIVEELKDTSKVKWRGFIPPTARVRSSINAAFKDGDTIVAQTNSVPSAGALEATLGNMKGYIRGRVLPYLPLQQDFEWASLTETNEFDGKMFAYPPLPWIGARFKFEVRDIDGNKVLAKTIDNKFFQRGTVFLSEQNAKNYTIQADIMTDGNRRKMSDAGIINQRYLIVLKGNEQKLEINSNLERFRYPAATEPSNFRWTPKTWYTVKSRVDVAPDGSGVIRAKAWKKGEPEPEKWILEVKHQNAHQEGSPGLFGFSPQDVPVYIDNILVTPN